MPTLFDSHEEFNEWFSKDIESHAENKSAIDESESNRTVPPSCLILEMLILPFILFVLYQLSRLHMILKPFMLRRIKKDVENELSDKVCNHPDLFERQETRSPFHMSVKPYVISKLLYRQGLIHACNQAKNKLLQVLLSPFSPNHIQQSLFHRKGLFLSLKAAYRLYYQRLFNHAEEHQEDAGDKDADRARLQHRNKCLSRKDLILWLNRPTAFPNTQTSPVLQDLVFTASRPGILGHTDVKIRSRNCATSTLRPCEPTLPPKFLLAATPKRYCADRSAEYEWRVMRSGGGTVYKQCFLYGSPELTSDWCMRANAIHPQVPGGVMALQPRHGWSFIRIPGKHWSIRNTVYIAAVWNRLLCEFAE
ncbi:hypothetical protein XENOCAPTIV_002513 [Xenoophorus captivus]|uniref:Chromatin-remodeling ATPase INO80 n=1 Tax=Xenoophorus captivus TaxID=1517983 RepID=A0ABV0QUR8_9TELE